MLHTTTLRSGDDPRRLYRTSVRIALRGPMSSASRPARRQYWREAPLLGLTGLSEISVRHEGVAAEAVAYDLNLACETLRECGPQLL